MGLFGKKEPCAICGDKVKGLFPWKIDGHLICNDCYGHADIASQILNNMTVQDFKEYMVFREENNRLKESFQVTQQIDFGWLDNKFYFDIPKRLMSLDKNMRDTLYEGHQIRSFVIKEDNMPLFEGDSSGLRRYISDVPARVDQLMPQITQYVNQMQMFRSMERMIDSLTDDEKQRHYHQRPRFDVPEPFRDFIVDIYFDHPYSISFTADMSGPTFSNDYPDANQYLREYNDRFATMEQLAQALALIAFPDASEEVIDRNAPMTMSRSVPVGGTLTRSAPAAAATAAAADPVEEIQRYKKLMEQGILTEEEFTAKKRQLLGI